MKLVTQDNLQSVLEQQDAMAVINAFQSLLRNKAHLIIRYRRYSGIIDADDLMSAAQLEIVQFMRQGRCHLAERCQILELDQALFGLLQQFFGPLEFQNLRA